MKKLIKTKNIRLKRNTLYTKETCAEETKLRPTTRILRTIIFMCCFLMVSGIVTGIFKGQYFSFLLGNKSIAEYRAAGLWLPILIFSAEILIYGWGTIIVFAAVCSLQMKKSTIGTILKSEIKSFYGDDGYDYRILSIVSYSVKGFRYENQGMHDFFSMKKEKAEEKLMSLKKGNNITVVYDPKNPNLMSLHSNYKAAQNELLSGIGFIIGGTILSIFLGIVLS